MLSRLFKLTVRLIKFYHRLYINLWLRRRGYRPVPAAEYILSLSKGYVRLVDTAPARKKRKS